MAVSQPGTRKPPTPSHEEGEGAFSYPAHITLSDGAERYLHQLGIDLALGSVEIRQLSPALRQLYIFAFEQGAASRQPEVDLANNDADRLYAEVCRRPPSRDGTDIDTFLQAQKHRGEAAAAARAEQMRAYIGGRSSDRYSDLSGTETS